MLTCMRLAGICDLPISRNARCAFRIDSKNAIGFEAPGQIFYCAVQSTQSAAIPRRTDIVPRGRWTSLTPLQARTMNSYAAEQVQMGAPLNELQLVSQ